MKFSTVLYGLVSALSISGADALVKPMDHEISILTPGNFEAMITANRQHGVSSVLFYKDNKESKAMINGWYNDAAKELKGMIRIGAVNCDEYSVFCKQHNTKGTYPTIVTYPPFPIPSAVYEGKQEKGALAGYLTRFIPNDNVKILNPANLEEFLQDRPEMPKALLFTTKDKNPSVWSALANSFHKEMHFGFVPASEESIAKRFGVSKAPQAVVVRANAKKHERFTDKVGFEPLHNWLNLFKETFVSGGGFSGVEASGGPSASKPARPWLSDPLPELFKPSADNLCFKKDDKSLCVIYVSNGELDPAMKNTLIGLKERFVSGLDDRGVSFKWMWINSQLEPEYKALFNVGDENSVVVFNPNKRLRFTKLDAGKAADATNISALLDKIAGGDARFTNVPGQKLPAFAKREVPKDEKEKRDEL